jgi:tetratricopeptide (TPR) repeat protein
MSSVATPSPASAVPPPEDRTLQALVWLEIHWRKLLAWFALFLVVVAAVYLWRHFQAEREAAANAALLSLRSSEMESDSIAVAAGPGDFLKVAEQYAGTTAEVRARLLAAGLLYQEGRYADAQSQFEQVLSGAGGNPLVAQAAFGVAACLDGLDRVDEAASRYQEVIQRFSTESVAGQAKLALARLEESRGQAAAALRLYDELLRDRDEGPFAQQAGQQRDLLVRRHPELAPADVAIPESGNSGAMAVPGAPVVTPLP